MLSVTSAIGQLFIYHTIKNFGAITFVLIMTVKQALSITASCVIYGHVLNFEAVMGVGIVFSALGARVFDKFRRNSSIKIKTK
jgi:adenosine 3'-phospho 5'-phosphosulfate transporter B2